MTVLYRVEIKCTVFDCTRTVRLQSSTCTCTVVLHNQVHVRVRQYTVQCTVLLYATQQPRFINFEGILRQQNACALLSMDRFSSELLYCSCKFATCFSLRTIYCTALKYVCNVHGTYCTVQYRVPK